MMKYFIFHRNLLGGTCIFTAFYQKAELQLDPQKKNHLIIAMSSDKGLCGAIHASISRAIRASIPEKPAGTEVKIICIGDKQRAALNRFVLRASRRIMRRRFDMQCLVQSP